MCIYAFFYKCYLRASNICKAVHKWIDYKYLVYCIRSIKYSIKCNQEKLVDIKSYTNVKHLRMLTSPHIIYDASRLYVDTRILKKQLGLMNCELANKTLSPYNIPRDLINIIHQYIDE